MTAGYLIAAVVLLLLNGFFVAAEFALVAARRTKIEALAKEGAATANLAQKSIRELTLTLAGAQLGITMCSLGLGFVGEPAIAHLLESAITSLGEIPETLLHTISFTVALTIVTFFHMVVGEMAPKNIAIAEPERTALLIALPFRAFVLVFGPILYLLNGIANAGCRLLGVEPQEERMTASTAEEIQWMVNQSAEQGVIGPHERRLLAGAAAFGERDAASAMVPRTEVVALPSTSTPVEIERVVVDSGHSRIPVYGENIDQILGFFHAKDLLKVPPAQRHHPLARRWIRPMLIVPESLKLPPLLLSMRRERKHFALVVDEHGGTAGVVTMEDVLEELVGEIRDEHDAGELGIEPLGDGRFVIPGTLRIDEAAESIGMELPEGDYETVAGLVMDRLGRVPSPNDSVEVDGWRLTVAEMHRRQIRRLLTEKIHEEASREEPSL
jgi:CBS domain containing-hemolysin-like protein